MTSVGSSVNHTFIKKVPDHQKEAVAKAKPFTMLNEERIRTMTPNSGPTPIAPSANSSYFEKGFKTFKDFKEIHKKLNHYENRIKEIKNYEEFEDLTDMYLMGQSKLKQEIQAALKVPAPARKLIILN